MSLFDALVLVAVFGAALAGAWRGRRPSIERFLGEPGERGWRAAFGLAGVDLTAITLIGLPAQSFGGDLRAVWLIAGALAGRALCAFFLVPGLYGRGSTVYAALESAFGAGGRRAAGLVFIPSRAAASGVRLGAAAAALAALCGGPPIFWAFAVAAASAALILPRGLPGALAAAVVQCGAAALAGLTALAVCVWLADGGVASLWFMAQTGERLSLAAPELSLWAGFWSRPDAALGSFFAGLLAAGASFAGDHEGAQKWLSAPNEESASRAALGAAAGAAALSLLFLSLGTALYALYRLTPGFSQPERAADVAAHFAGTLLPSGARGLFAAAILLVAADLPGLSLAASARDDLGVGRSRSLRVTRLAAAGGVVLCLAWALVCSRWEGLARASLVFSTIGFGALFGAVAASALTTASGETAILGFFGALLIGLGLGVAGEAGRLTLAWTWLGPLTALASFLLCGPYGFAHH